MNSVTQNLHLEIVGADKFGLGDQRRFVFRATGGAIGRSSECAWILPKAGVSRLHAVIRYLNGLYFLEDHSTNGVLLNGERVEPSQPVPLSDGDRMCIDVFQISVRLVQDDSADELSFQDSGANQGISETSGSAEDSAASLDVSQNDAFSQASSKDRPLQGSDDIDSDPLQLLDKSGNWRINVSEVDAYVARAPDREVAWPKSSKDETGAGNPGSRDVLPENWDIPTEGFVGEESTGKSFGSSPGPGAGSGLESSGQLSSQLAEILKLVTEGVMDVLRARAEIKNSFRMPMTIVETAENNPLKFARNPEQALQQILAPEGDGYLSGVHAFEDAFQDIRNHQMAMLAGVRAAFDGLLSFFDPDYVQNRMERDSTRSAVMRFTSKGKCWEHYCKEFESLSQNPDDTFRRLFGDEFARAYEDQLARLHRAGKRR